MKTKHIVGVLILVLLVLFAPRLICGNAGEAKAEPSPLDLILEEEIRFNESVDEKEFMSFEYMKSKCKKALRALKISN